ncbi:MAG: glycoside hydrolase family 2 TIM barrel-domain containing protein [Terriglobales bacterium]
MTLPIQILCAALTLSALANALAAQEKPSGNLALAARATASSASEGTKAENLTDGDIAHTQWTAKDGTNPADTWVELNWPGMVQFQEVVIRQEGDRKLSHLNLEIRDASGEWHLLQSIGDSQHLLPRLILAQFGAQHTNGLRLSGFAGAVSLNEVEVYDRTDPPVVVLASDLRNHIFGIVTDGFGTQPFADAAVQLEGTAGGTPWRASARTDENGIFQVDMPVGMEGEVTATAQLTSRLASELGNSVSPKCTVQAGDLTPGLSLPDDNAAALDLNGTWRFKPDPEPEFFQTSFSDSDWKDIKVPAHWMMEGFDSKSGIGGYRRRLQIPASFRSRRIKLLFEGVYSGAEVWLNGKRVGSHEGGFAPFELDVTNVARIGGDNLLEVLVRENTLSSHLDDMSSYANFPLAGIFRQVRIFSVPEAHVRRFHVQTVFDASTQGASYKDATLTLDLSVENESSHEINGAPLVFSLKDPDGHLVPLANDHLDVKLAPWSRLEQRMEFHVASPEHWEAEHPRLYTLTAKLSGAAGASEVVSRRVGFRQVEIRGTEFLINGVPVKLRGSGYFESDPLTGRTITPDRARSDLQMLKEANLDAFRTEVILPLEELYDDADELGFYVEAESPFCWVDESSDLRYLPTFVQRTAEILDRERSHPSIIIWSVGNESTSGPDFEAAHQFVKKQDLTRPASAGQSATLELDTMHNPISLARMKERESVTVPILWDESFLYFSRRPLG